MAELIRFTPSEVAAAYAAILPQLRQSGAEWRCKCPVHNGERDSFSADPKTGLCTCHSGCGGKGWNLITLQMELAGTDFKTAKAEIFRIVGRVTPSHNKRPTSSLGPIVVTYNYTDENGGLLYQAVRYDQPKDFRQRQPDGEGGWTSNIRGVRLVLYRLTELLKRPTETVFICEGEKDVHALESLGLLATTNAMGAGKWKPEYSEMLRGRAVVILPDLDPPTDDDGKPHYRGQRHAVQVAADLMRVGCEVRIVEVPKGKDIFDWIAAGGTREELLRLAPEQSTLTPESLELWRARWEPTVVQQPHQTARARAGSLVTRRMSDINPKPVSWLWPGRIARGKVSIIAGNSGLGKSQTTASMAATITTGGLWPVDRSQCTPGDVIFLSAEDDPADTLRPRLEAAGANLQRVHVMDAVIVGYTGEGQQQNRAFSLQADVAALSAKLAELGDVAAVVIDPITAYLGDVDSHRNAEVRSLLTPLSELAAKHDTAIIGVSHLNKSAGTEAMMRVTGSLAFVAAARAAYLVAQDPENPARRLFLPMKNNIGPDSTGLAFRIEAATIQSSAGPLETSQVVWDSDPVTTTADEAMRTQVTEHGSALREAEEWLQEALSEPTPQTVFSSRAEEAGIKKKTLNRASQSLRVVKEKIGMTGGWVWSLRPKMPKTPEDAQQNCMGTFDEVGHLRQSEEAMLELDL